MINQVIKFCIDHTIDTLDIATIKKTALKYKQYALIEYLNNNIDSYLQQVKKDIPKHTT